MPPTPPDHLTLPREYVDQAFVLGGRNAAAYEDLADEHRQHREEVREYRDELRQYRDEVRPVVEAYGAELKARAEARAKVNAEREEGRSTLAAVATSKPAVAAYTAGLTLLAAWLSTLAGAAP